jgi:hypothetical protein
MNPGWLSVMIMGGVLVERLLLPSMEIEVAPV